MAFGVKGPCDTCKYLDKSDREGSKYYCEWLKSYIVPDYEGCGHHAEED